MSVIWREGGGPASGVFTERRILMIDINMKDFRSARSRYLSEINLS